EVVKGRLGAVSPWMGLVDAVGGTRDDCIVNFSMRRARDAAWEVAERYAPLDAAARLEAERDLDDRIAHFARVVLKPGRIITTAALVVRLRERAEVADVIEALYRPESGQSAPV